MDYLNVLRRNKDIEDAAVEFVREAYRAAWRNVELTPTTIDIERIAREMLAVKMCEVPREIARAANLWISRSKNGVIVIRTRLEGCCEIGPTQRLDFSMQELCEIIEITGQFDKVPEDSERAIAWRAWEKTK